MSVETPLSLKLPRFEAHTPPVTAGLLFASLDTGTAAFSFKKHTTSSISLGTLYQCPNLSYALHVTPIPNPLDKTNAIRCPKLTETLGSADPWPKKTGTSKTLSHPVCVSD